MMLRPEVPQETYDATMQEAQKYASSPIKNFRTAVEIILVELERLRKRAN